MPWYGLGVLLKIANELPRPFCMGVPATGGETVQSMQGQSQMEAWVCVHEIYPPF